MINRERLINLRKNMSIHCLEQILVTSTSSLFYLLGEWVDPGERMLVLYVNQHGKPKLFVNALFPVENDPDLDIVVFTDSDSPVAILSDTINGHTPLGIEKVWPSHFLIDLMETHPEMSFKNASPCIDEVRMVKDAAEINLMREACQVNDSVMADLIGEVLPQDLPETKVCRLLLDLYEKNGTPGFSFFPLIAYGPGAAEPHHESDGTKMKKGDSIILDIGGRTNRYCSDMTRTVFWGEPNEESKKIYETVRQANLAGIAAVKPGVRFCDIDKAARDVITEAGYGPYFTHRLGHNIGLDVHEFPDVGEKNEMPTQEGMVFTIEPGIYLPGRCGVRIEDIVVVTATGCEVLNTHPKEMICL